VLHFHLVGINNQNFLMADDETGSWWQQVTGECIRGPLVGRRLTRIPSDEVSLAVWRAEHPESTAVRFAQQHLAGYAPANWEEHFRRLPVLKEAPPGAPLAPRDLVVGVESDSSARAFPLDVLGRQSPVNTHVGRTPVLIVLAADGRSARGFLRTLEGRVLEFYRKPDSPGTLLDDATGSEWTFAGLAVAGPLAGRRLEWLQTQTEYWFDWLAYHPQTTVFSAGEARTR
jgi:hypothetical protein